jgi:hypothetical protein
MQKAQQEQFEVDSRRHPFRDGQQDREASHVPNTPQTRSSAYALGVCGPEFILPR